MEQALLVVKEINRLKRARDKSKSMYLKNDYSKNIRYLMKELKFYCDNKGLDYYNIINK